MIENAGFAGFLLAAILAEITPGPNMSYLAIVALGDGRRAGLAAVAGVASGLMLLGIVAALGMAAAITAVPGLEGALRGLGVAYLLWLAWQGWRGAEDGIEHAARGSSPAQFFLRGMITNLLNPKAFAFYLAVLPAFMPQAVTQPMQFVALAWVYVMIATAVHVVIVLGASRLTRHVLAAGSQVTVRRILALLLALIAAWLAIAA